MMIPYSTQNIDDEDIKAVSEALKNEYLTGGPMVDKFERLFAQYVGSKFAVAISSGTAALHAACAVIGIGEGDEVITTPNTWVSTAGSIIYCGGRPVFADIDKDTYNIDPEDIERKITKRTKAIIAVHYAGQPCDMDRINAIAKDHNLYVIEDAAHAVGAFYKGKAIGSISDLTTFSFHPVKQMTTCEGGMITTNNEDYYNKLKLFRSYGMVKTQQEIEKEGPWFSEQKSMGYNYRLSDVSCALGISQLAKIDTLVNRRRQIAEIYDREFADIDSIILPNQLEKTVSSYHLYPILVDSEKRKELYFKYRENGIGVGVHYYPVYKNEYYQKKGYSKVHCEISERFYARELSLPIHYNINENEIDMIVSVTRELLK